MQHVNVSCVLDMHEQSSIYFAKSYNSVSLIKSPRWREREGERQRESQERPVNTVVCHPNLGKRCCSLLKQVKTL